MASAPVLADPSAMTSQGLTDELVASIRRDDLLGVLLVLSYCAEAEVNSTGASLGHRTRARGREDTALLLLDPPPVERAEPPVADPPLPCATARSFGASPLETALLYPTSRTPVRRIIAECLLQRGARADHLVQDMPSRALPVIESVLRGWHSGGSEQGAL